MTTLRTLPLSEFNFTATAATTDTEEWTAAFDKDLLFTGTGNKGVITPSIITSPYNNHKFRFKNRSEWLQVDAKGNYLQTADVGNTGVIDVRCGCLTKRISVECLTGNFTSEFAPGTLGKHIMDYFMSLIDGLAPSETTKRMFATRNEETGEYTWNHDCWAWPVDLTCMAPWRDKGGIASSTAANHFWPVTAITPRHIVCGHVATWVGEKYHFFARDNTVVEREVIARQQIPANGYGMTYWVGLLDSDLPPSITPAKLLPDGVYVGPNYFPGFRGSHGMSLPDLPGTAYNPNGIILPVLGTDQEKKALVNGLSYIRQVYDSFSSRPGYVYKASFVTKFNFDRTWPSVEVDWDEDWSETTIGGDSSSPILWVINGETVLLTSATFWGSGAGLYYAGYLDEIKTIMDNLSGGSSPYYPETVDLSGFHYYG